MIRLLRSFFFPNEVAMEMPAEETRRRLRALRERSEAEDYEKRCAAQLSRTILSYEDLDKVIHSQTLEAMREEIKSLRELERLWEQK